jgi:3-dehydroquinate synthase
VKKAKVEKKLTVGLAENSYDILIEDGLLDKLGRVIRLVGADDGKIAVVTDENIWAAWGERFSSSMEKAGAAFLPIVLPAGEGNKSLQGLSGLYDSFAKMQLTRNGLVVAFGGGVVGDLCGFAAATWMRGVRFVQAPTTLLAQVDSSVGGKTAVNLAQGKNLVGTFYQPKFVAIDPGVLRTLPAREMRSGMAEVIKYGAIRSRQLFDSLLTDAAPDLSEVICECCRIKAEIVERDERDFGDRMLLNFGHTLGHAIERQGRFERHRHGEAVAFGMVLAASAGEAMGLSAPGVAEELRLALAKHGLDTECPYDVSALLPSLSADKKSSGDGVRMVMLRRIGDAFIHRASFSEIGKALAAAGRARG